MISWQHPSGITVYPQFASPSVESWISCPVSVARTQRFSSRENAAHLPSGERISSLGRAVAFSEPVQRYATMSQVKRAESATWN